MNILIQKSSHPILMGISNCLIEVVDNYIIWDISKCSLYQILDTCHIDLIILDSSNISLATIEAIKEFNIPVVIFGFIATKLSQTCLQIIPSYVNSKIIENVSGPVYVAHYGANLLPCWNSTLSIDNDVLIINTINAEKFLQLYQRITRYKVIGNEKLPIPEYLGTLNITDITDIIKAHKTLVLTGPDYMYDIAINKGFAISLVPNSIYPVTEAEFLDAQITHFLNNQKHRTSIIKQAYRIACENTYFHRTSDILNILNYSQEAKKCLSKVSEYLSTR
jgi:hypothetical protein